MEPGTGLAILGSALGGAKIIEKILGPTAEYLGDGLHNWTKRRVHNVAGIFTNAGSKLGDRIDEPGSIPLRVLKEILDEGSYCDDPLMAEYFGGVLASSRTQISRDDRGAYWTSLVARLSTYQIRSHFLIYRAIYDRFQSPNFDFDINDPGERPKLSVLIPYSEYWRSMDFTNPKELSQVDSLLSHALFGLHREGLIESFHYGNKENLKIHIGRQFIPDEGGIWITPSSLGMELFSWVNGQGNLPLSTLFHQTLGIPEGIVPCARVLNKDDLAPPKPQDADR